MKWIYLLIAVSGEVVATSALKASEGFSKIHAVGNRRSRVWRCVLLSVV